MVQHLINIQKPPPLCLLYYSVTLGLFIQGYYCFYLFHLSISSYFFLLTYINFKHQFSPCSPHQIFPFGQETTTFPSTKNHFSHAWLHCSHFTKSNPLADTSWSDRAQMLIWLFSMILIVTDIFNLPQTSLFLVFGWLQLSEFLCSCHPTLEASLCLCLNRINRTLPATWRHFLKAPTSPKIKHFCVEQL